MRCSGFVKRECERSHRPLIFTSLPLAVVVRWSAATAVSLIFSDPFLRSLTAASLSFSEIVAVLPALTLNDARASVLFLPTSVSLPAHAVVARHFTGTPSLPCLSLDGSLPIATQAFGVVAGGGCVPPGTGCTVTGVLSTGGGVVQSVVPDAASPRSALCWLPARSRAWTSKRYVCPALAG